MKTLTIHQKINLKSKCKILKDTKVIKIAKDNYYYYMTWIVLPYTYNSPFYIK